jgi:MFS transporter, UMF1 family
MPVTVEQLARENGVLANDMRTPCQDAAQTNATSSLLSRHLEPRESDRCVVHLFGGDMDTASFALYTQSLAVFMQALTLVSISAMADHGMDDDVFLHNLRG